MVICNCKNKLAFAQPITKKGCVNMKNNLQKIRWGKDWSQNQLARISNVPQSTIDAIENKNRIPSVLIALRLARALSVSVEDIFALD